MSSPKYMNNYRLQYWLYAILNNRFGKMVTFKRDNLHSRYSVNRHGFDVHGISPQIILKELEIVLTNCGYAINKKSEDNSSILMTKSIMHENKEEKHYINIAQNKTRTSKSYLQVGASMYLF